MELTEYETMAQLEDEYWWYQSLRRLVLWALHTELPRGGRPRILDAGCGTGAGLAHWSRLLSTAQVIGIDIAPVALQHAARRHTGPLIRGSVVEQPFHSSTFDAVLSLDVWSATGVDDQRAVQEAVRVLRPGGVLLLNLPAFGALRGTHDAAIHIRQRYDKSSVERLLHAVGLKIQRLLYWNACVFPVALAIRRLSRLRLRLAGPEWIPPSDLTPLPRPVNRLLTGLSLLDTWLCRRVQIPVGTSVFAVAIKP